MIPILDLKTQYHALKNEILEAVEAVFESGHFINGPEVEGFERELRELKAEVMASLGPEDLAHLQKLERWGRWSTALGYATAWTMPNPVTMALLSTGSMAQWTIIAHHVLHKGMDHVPGTPIRGQWPILESPSPPLRGPSPRTYRGEGLKAEAPLPSFSRVLVGEGGRQAGRGRIDGRPSVNGFGGVMRPAPSGFEIPLTPASRTLSPGYRGEGLKAEASLQSFSRVIVGEAAVFDFKGFFFMSGSFSKGCSV